MKRIRFLKDITVDWVNDNNFDGGSKFYRQNNIIEVLEIQPISTNWSNIILPDQTALSDIRNDWFEEVIE
jgi:hypothetical protein